MQKVPYFARVNSSPAEVQQQNNAMFGKHNQLMKGPSGISSREQYPDYNNLIVTNTPTQQLLQANQQNKPKTSSVTHRIHILHNAEKQAEAINDQMKVAPLKMKLHNFDPLSLGFTHTDGIGPSTIPILENGRQQINALHLGNVQTKSLFLNTLQPTQSSNLQTLPATVIQGSKSKNIQSNQQLPNKNMKLMQVLPNQLRVSTNQQSNRAQKQMYVRKIINTQPANQQILSQQNQFMQGNKRENQQQILSTPVILQSVVVEKNNQLVQGNPQNKLPFFNRGSLQLARGQSQNSQRKIEDKNMKILSNAISTNKVYMGPNNAIRNVEPFEQANEYQLLGNMTREDEKISINDQGGSPTQMNQRYSVFDYNSINSNAVQYQGRNSDTVFQKPSELLSAITNTNYQDQITTQLYHQKTGGSTYVSPSQKNKWPRKNTQGLQGSIYSSSATSSIEENNVIFLNESEGRQNNIQVHNSDNNLIITQDQGYQQEQPKKFFLQRNCEQQSPDSCKQNTFQPEIIDRQAQRNFASTFNPQIEQIGLFENSEGMMAAKQLINKKNSRQVIAKSNIKFASSSSNQTSGAQNQEVTKQEEHLTEKTSTGPVNDDNPTMSKKKTLKKIRDAQQQADSFDKKGIDKAIVQYQFEMADKDEENCFKDLYDTLSEFF